MQDTQKKGYMVWIGAGVLVVLAAIYGVFTYGKKEETPALNSGDNTDGETENTPAETESYMYKNGTYSAVGTYVSPAGPESIDVKVTITNDVITDATVVSKASNPTSVTVQGMFIGGYKPLVIGKKIDNVVLDKVAGSSLTPKGWNDAIIKIKAGAQS